MIDLLSSQKLSFEGTGKEINSREKMLIESLLKNFFDETNKNFLISAENDGKLICNATARHIRLER